MQPASELSLTELLALWLSPVVCMIVGHVFCLHLHFVLNLL